MKYCYFLIVLLLLTISCKQDKCKDVNCQNDGVCQDGTCWCVAGYEGFHCETPWRDKYAGTWNVEETAQGTTNVTQYQVLVVIDSHAINVLHFQVGNLHQIQHDSCDLVVQPQGFTFSPNQILDNNIKLLSGNGVRDSTGNTITVTYSLEDNGDTTTYNAIWTK